MGEKNRNNLTNRRTATGIRTAGYSHHITAIAGVTIP